MQRRYADYRPLSKRRRWLLRHPPLRAVRLNTTGWAAVALLCLACAASGYAVGRVLGWPGAPGGIAGAILGFTALVALDRRHWAAIETTYSWDADPDAVASVAAALQARGIPVQLAVQPNGRASLQYRNRDAKQVRRALLRLGVRPPRR